MSDGKGAPSTAPSTPARFPSQADEALRQARATDGRSAADRAAFAAASHVSTSGLSRKGRAALDRLDAALPEARTLTSYKRRDVRNTMSRVWGV